MSELGFITIALLFLLGIAGALLALLIGVVCGLIALRRGLNILQFAVIGVVYGFFISPWPYLLSRMFNCTLPLPLIGLIYLFPCVICLVVATMTVGNIIWIWENTTGFGGHEYIAPDASVFSATLMSLFLVGLAAVCIYGLFRSLRTVYRQYRFDRSHTPKDHVPDMTYLRPFFYAYGWLMGGLVIAIVVAAYAISIGLNIQGF